MTLWKSSEEAYGHPCVQQSLGTENTFDLLNVRKCWQKRCCCSPGVMEPC